LLHDICMKFLAKKVLENPTSGLKIYSLKEMSQLLSQQQIFIKNEVVRLCSEIELAESTAEEILAQAHANWNLRTPLRVAKSQLIVAKREVQRAKELVDETTKNLKEAEKKCQLAQETYYKLVEKEPKKIEKIEKIEKMDAPKKTSAPKKEKSPRDPSPYNKYMREEIIRVKTETPSLDHKAAFKQAAANWKFAKENPKGVEKTEIIADEALPENRRTSPRLATADEMQSEDVFV